MCAGMYYHANVRKLCLARQWVGVGGDKDGLGELLPPVHIHSSCKQWAVAVR